MTLESACKQPSHIVGGSPIDYELRKIGYTRDVNYLF